MIDQIKTMFPILFVGAFLSSCIGNDLVEDRVEPEVRITNPIDSIEINTFYSFMSLAFNNTGQRINDADINWTSLDTSIIEIDSITGVAQAKKTGTTAIEIFLNHNGEVFEDQNIVSVGETTVAQSIARTGSLRTTSSYTLRGDFTLEEDNGMLRLSLASNYAASSSLPGLYVYLTNNPNTTASAVELGPAMSFSGSHSYAIPQGVSLNDYRYVLYFCKPFNVKVGDGEFDN